jgi:hypothetical protein
MICNDPLVENKADVDTIEYVLDAIRKSSIGFWLTGSRFANPDSVGEDTDFDFFTPYCEQTENFLIDLGFTKIVDEKSPKRISVGYGSIDAKSVYRFITKSDLYNYMTDHETGRGKLIVTHTGLHIDVQLTKPDFLTAKILVNQFVRKCPCVIYGMSKKRRRMIWPELIHLALSDTSSDI